jgi:hypothetical protein
MTGVNGVGCRIAFILVLGMLWSFAASATAFAQAGSTGGTIGKQDKSISGGKDAADSQRAVPMRKPPLPARQPAATAPAGGPCNRIVGTWLWYNGVSVTVHSNSNTTTQSDGHSATVVCAGGTYSFTWLGIHTVRETLSSDGKRLSGDESAVRQ